jgi:hypothetical protein
MKSKLINDPYRNPFHNRFRVPVHSRLDEMQAFTHMIWLNDYTALSREKAEARMKDDTPPSVSFVTKDHE